MILIKPSFEILEQEPGEVGMKKLIEKAKRVCYKSEDKITDNSYIKAVQGLIDLKHGAMLEHGTVYLYIPLYEGDFYQQDDGSIDMPFIIRKYYKNKYSVLNIEDDIQYSGAYITTNYRVLIENNWLDDLKYQCEPTEHHEKRVTVKFICDRGVSHEFVRHKNILCVA